MENARFSQPGGKAKRPDWHKEFHRKVNEFKEEAAIWAFVGVIIEKGKVIFVRWEESEAVFDEAVSEKGKV